MRTIATRSIAILVALLLMAAPGAAQQSAYLGIVNAKVAYAADIVMSNGKVTVTGRIFHRPGITRTELVIGKSRTVTIHDLKRNRMMIFRVGQKHYRETGTAKRAIAAYMPPGTARKDLRVEPAGSEAVGGEATGKLKVSYPSGSMLLWQTKDGIVVKMAGHATVRERKAEVTMSLKNLKRGSQDAALFAVPKGLKRFILPSRR